jgi:hypothetical protein
VRSRAKPASATRDTRARSRGGLGASCGGPASRSRFLCSRDRRELPRLAASLTRRRARSEPWRRRSRSRRGRRRGADVVDVVDHARERRREVDPAFLGQHSRVELDADDAAGPADLVDLRVGQVTGVGREHVGVRMRGDERRLRGGGDIPEAGSFRCERSSRIPRRLHALTSRLPASVSPSPTSGEDGKRNGAPFANAFGRAQTSPSERSPRS